jgi:hypothetical protein
MKTLSVRDAISWPALLLCAALLGAVAGAVQAADSDTQTPYTQEWRVLPGESLNSLAKLFYPKSSSMQQRFVRDTLALNREQLPDLKAGTAFEQETRINIPNLHDLSKQAIGGSMVHRHKASTKAKVSGAAAPVAESASPTSAPTVAPEKAAATGAGQSATADYEAMSQRNDARQKELDKLNDRLKSLEQSSKTIKESLDKDNQAMQGAVADAQQPSQAAPADAAPPAVTPAPVPANDAGGKKLKRVQPPPAPVEAPDELGLPILLGVGLAVLLVAFGAYRWLRGKK